MPQFVQSFRTARQHAVCSIASGQKGRCTSRALACLIEAAVLALLADIGTVSVAQAPAAQDLQQLSTSAGQMASGGKMSFEVASIHLTKPGSAGIAWGIHLEPSGRLVADFPLLHYIEFAYKILPIREREDAMLASLPEWARSDSFVIQAEAPENPTEDQMRLMMQSLLAARFNLKVHFETPTEPVFALILAKPGRLGPRIRLHSQGLPCGAKWIMPTDRTSPSVPPGELLAICGQAQAFPGPDRTLLLGARDVTLDYMAEYIAAVTHLGRPVINRTGLTGQYDFTLQWTPERTIPATVSDGNATGQLDLSGPTLSEALKDQFGLKLKSMRDPVRTLVIDHVELPSPN